MPLKLSLMRRGKLPDKSRTSDSTPATNAFTWGPRRLDLGAKARNFLKSREE
jgi:hypothetical protein